MRIFVTYREITPKPYPMKVKFLLPVVAFIALTNCTLLGVAAGSALDSGPQKSMVENWSTPTNILELSKEKGPADIIENHTYQGNAYQVAIYLIGPAKSEAVYSEGTTHVSKQYTPVPGFAYAEYHAIDGQIFYKNLVGLSDVPPAKTGWMMGGLIGLILDYTVLHGSAGVDFLTILFM
jgi:hypothetical protein